MYMRIYVYNIYIYICIYMVLGIWVSGNEKETNITKFFKKKII